MNIVNYKMPDFKIEKKEMKAYTIHKKDGQTITKIDRQPPCNSMFYMGSVLAFGAFLWGLC